MVEYPIVEDPIVEEEEEEIKPKPKPKRTKKEKEQLQEQIKTEAEQLENTVRDISKMKLKYPNPFSSRLEERMPQLFVKSKDEKFDLYTRMCPFSLSERRQPVILTKEEKDKIIAEHPDEVDEESDFIEYGSDSKDNSKKFYYTCPRYWCLLTDTMVTEQDILDGKCGPKVAKVEDAIIPKKADSPGNRTVYQFYEGNERKYPGFHKQKMPSGMCIPCCYSNWSTTEMKNRRDICQGKFDDKTAEQVSDKERELEDRLRRETAEVEYYVKGPEKYGPQLGEHRWGFLPISVQKFLHEVNEDCQISKTNMNLKLNHMCILRHGIEVSSTQSFIACISSAIFYAQKDDNGPLINRFIPNAKHDVPTIKEMRELLINAMDLDKFVKYQNGDLITSFANPELKVNIEDYRNTKLYEKMTSTSKALKKQSIKNNEVVDESSIAAKHFIEKVGQSFESFKNFLRDDKMNIDYTHLWDLVSMPNPKLFESGINLIILEIPEDDPTNNIELVCPTNHYSDHIYDARKRSLLLVKRENYFEPIYGYKNDGKHIHITKTFSEYDKKLPPTLRAVFAKIIKPTLGEKCRSFVSRPNEYRFKAAPILDKLITTLLHKKYKIGVQVLNFQGKVIGVMARNKKGLEGFIPCYPSALTNLKPSKSCDINSSNSKCEYDFVYMNDSIWKPYEQTLEFMKVYYDYEEPKDIKSVNCYNPKYFCRVAEDNLITGFLTNSDQFIPIKDPVPISSVYDDIKTIENGNMLVADVNTLTNNKVDTKRVDFIKRIQLETNFYNVFRNTIRILLNDNLNSDKRKKIKEKCNAKYAMYKNQLNEVISMLYDLVEDTILFASEKKMPYKYDDINEKQLNTCVSQDLEKCKIKGSICKIKNNKCQLVLPKQNLVNGTDNEEYYYGRMADELIRYNRIKSFVFKPQSYLSFEQIKYNLRDDEIIVLQDLLNNEFFENLIPANINRYAKYNTYDTAEPIISQAYKKGVEIDEVINPHHIRECVKLNPQQIKSAYWKKCFPESYRQINYTNTNDCPLYLIIDLISEFKKKNVTIEELKDALLEEYSKLTDNFTNQYRIQQIIDILREEAQYDANQLLDNTMTIEQMILNDGFVAVNFDLWILLVKYQIPSFFISSKFIPETRYNLHEFVCYTQKDEKQYAFIIVPAMYKRELSKMPEFKIITNGEESVKIQLDDLLDSECLRNIENAIDSYVSIEDYVDSVFEKDVTTKYKLKKEGLRPIEFEIVDETIQEDPKLRKDDLEEGEEFEIIPKKKVKRVKKKIIHKLVLEEDNEEIPEPKKLEDIVFPEKENKEEEEEEIFIIPKKKTKTQRKKKLSVNPPGNRKTKKAPIQFDIVDKFDDA
jgi:hypothetical protein